jgi:hypothetical protein
MLTPEEDMEITALRKRGWSISAIARHVGHDRKTVKAYLNGEQPARRPPEAQPSIRSTSSSPTSVSGSPMTRMCGATVLFVEVARAGVRTVLSDVHPGPTGPVDLRPHCEACASSKGRAHVDIDHPPGEEIQWDWLELGDTPWGTKLYVLVGALSHSGKFRAWCSDSDDQAHLIVGIHEILRAGWVARPETVAG